MTTRKLRLGVNIDHVATLRNARGSAWPDPLRAALLAEATQGLGGLDTVLIAHGTLTDQERAQQDVAYALQEIQTNGTSVVSLMTLAGEQFAQQGRGAIAVISSVAGDRGRQSNYVYGSAKALVSAFASGLRQRLSKQGVHVVTMFSDVAGSMRETHIGADNRAAGEAQFADSLRRLRTDRFELLAVHNLRDWKTQLALARELKAQGKVKYVGLTHFMDSSHDTLADIIAAEKPDFVQINYAVGAPNAEKRVLPVAADNGVAVMVNRAFDDGKLFSRVAGEALPGWAAEVGVTSWAQMFLKFALSHPAVTVVIPATGKPDRQTDNLRAGSGDMLDAAQRAELIAKFA